MKHRSDKKVSLYSKDAEGATWLWKLRCFFGLPNNMFPVCALLKKCAFQMTTENTLSCLCCMIFRSVRNHPNVLALGKRTLLCMSEMLIGMIRRSGHKERQCQSGKIYSVRTCMHTMHPRTIVHSGGFSFEGPFRGSLSIHCWAVSAFGVNVDQVSLWRGCLKGALKVPCSGSPRCQAGVKTN